jgi:hypothetical protein
MTATDWTREELIAFVNRSPERVAAHDRAAWLALFDPDGEVEDPVGVGAARRGRGVRGVRGDDELARFYDTFIGPNDVRFEVAQDLCVGRHVVRDVTIHIRLPTGLAVHVPAYLRYDLAAARGALRIARMAAHWELPSIARQCLSAGVRGARTLASNTARILRVQGPAGAAAYTRAMVTGLGAKGHALAHALADALNARDEARLRALFVDAGPRVEWVPDAPAPPAALLAPARAPAAPWACRAPLSSGRTCAFRFAERGVAFLAVAPRSARIERAWFFTE